MAMRRLDSKGGAFLFTGTVAARQWHLDTREVLNQLPFAVSFEIQNHVYRIILSSELVKRRATTGRGAVLLVEQR